MDYIDKSHIVFESHKFLAYVYFYLIFFLFFFRRCILLAQLTIPWEDRLAILNQQNKTKYLDLIGEAVIKWAAEVLCNIHTFCKSSLCN